MAEPIVEGTKNGSFVSGGATSFTVDISDIANGKWMIVMMQCSSQSPWTPPSAAWIPMIDNAVGITMGSRKIAAYAKIKETADGAGATFTVGGPYASRWLMVYGSGSNPISDWIKGITGVRSAGNVVSGVTVQAGDGTHSIAPSVTTLAPDTLVIGLFFEVTNATETGPPYYLAGGYPAGWTDVYSEGTSELLIIGKKSMPTIGATGAASMAYQNSQASNGAGIQIAIAPVGASIPAFGSFGGTVNVGIGSFTGVTPAEPPPSEISVIGSVVNETGTGSSAILARPGGLQNGDWLVAFARGQGASTYDSNADDIFNSQGFIRASAIPTSGNWLGSRPHGIFVKPITDAASEPANYTFTFEGGAMRHMSALLVVRPSAGKIISLAGASDGYGAVGTLADRGISSFETGVPGIQLGFWTGEWSVGNDHAVSEPPTGWDPLAYLVSPSTTISASRTSGYVAKRKVTASPTGVQLIHYDYASGPAGPGQDSIVLREITPALGAGSFSGIITIAPGGFDGFKPQKVGTGFNSVADFLRTNGATSAHRGGSVDSPDMSMRAYRRAVSRGYGLLEFSAQRTSDGVWIGNHNPDINETSQSAGIPAISTMTWAQIQQYNNTLKNQGFGVPYLKLVDFLQWAINESGCIVMLDPKNALSFVAEFNVIAAAYGGPNKIIMKYFGAGASIGAVARAWRDAGYETWGYFYPDDAVPGGALDIYQDNWTILGMNYNASIDVWNKVKDYNVTAGIGRTGKKPVMGHITPDQAGYDMAMARGAKYVQVSGTAAVAAVNGLNVPAPEAKHGVFVSSVGVGPGVFTGVRPVETTSMIGYGRIKARYLAAIADSNDVGVEPDVEPLTGYVIFTASVKAVRIPGAVPDPVTVYLAPIQVPLDNDGYLSTVNGKLVSLLATNDADGTPVGWRWKVEFFLQFQGKAVPADSFWFELPESTIVDLTTVTRYASATD